MNDEATLNLEVAKKAYTKNNHSYGRNIVTLTEAIGSHSFMDASGSVASSGWAIEKRFVAQLIEEAVPSASRVGIIRFASNVTTICNLTSVQNKTEIIDTINKIVYTRGYTHTKDAMVAAINMLETQGSPERDFLIVLITDGNPVPLSQTPCSLATQLKSDDINVVIIGVGQYWTQEEIDCIVVDDSKDIIKVGSFNSTSFDAVRSTTDQYLCPSNIQLLLSEVKPVPGTYDPVAFIELYNQGADINLTTSNLVLTGLFSGTISSKTLFFGNSSTWYNGDYLVLFDNSESVTVEPFCWKCNCTHTIDGLCKKALYVGCNGTGCQYNSVIDNKAVNVTYWYQNLYDDESGENITIFNITYGKGGSTWPIITEGYSYEVSDIGFCSGEYGQCWQQSCYYYGTPGDKPVECNRTDIVIVPPTNCVVYLNSSKSLDIAKVVWDKASVSTLYTVRYEVSWYDENQLHQFT